MTNVGRRYRQGQRLNPNRLTLTSAVGEIANGQTRTEPRALGGFTTPPEPSPARYLATSPNGSGNFCGKRQAVSNSLLMAYFLVWFSTVGWGQAESEPTRKPDSASTSAPDDEAKLIDGLLELLDAPVPKPTVTSNAGGSITRSNDKSPAPLGLRPADVGLDGEDLGENNANPLRAVRQSMMIAAGYLERGLTSSDTQTIQRDIVQRLDELITHLEDSAASDNEPRPEQDAPQSAAEQQTNQTQQQSQSQPDPSAGTEDESPQKDSAEVIGDGPGNRGGQAQAVVELSDPAALQESLWGQLPERVRKQMQSRMVERFLPSYREQIEAYFQALLKQEQE